MNENSPNNLQLLIYYVLREKIAFLVTQIYTLYLITFLAGVSTLWLFNSWREIRISNSMRRHVFAKKRILYTDMMSRLYLHHVRVWSFKWFNICEHMFIIAMLKLEQIKDNNPTQCNTQNEISNTISNSFLIVNIWMNWKTMIHLTQCIKLKRSKFNYFHGCNASN